MQCDTVVSPEIPGFEALGIHPTPIADVLDEILG